MNKSENIIELSKAMVKFQGRIKTIKATEENPHFRHKYAGLGSIWDEIRAPLSECGLAIIQSPEVDGTTITVVTTLVHESGQYIENSLKMVAADTRPQSVGSCITYGRRYSLASILGLSSEEDDDGNAASSGQETGGKGKKSNTPQQTPPQPDDGKPKQIIPQQYLDMCIAEINTLRASGITPQDLNNAILETTGRNMKLMYVTKDEIDKIILKLKKKAEGNLEKTGGNVVQLPKVSQDVDPAKPDYTALGITKSTVDPSKIPGPTR